MSSSFQSDSSPRSSWLPRGLLALLLVLVAVGGVAPADAQEEEGEDDSGITSGVISSLSWRSIGPAFMSGRISEIAVDPTDHDIWYAAAASGNAWKTTNAGITWTPIFESYGSYSIGTIVVDPHDPNTIWIGTGENNSQRSVGYGDGIYKSVDAGKSFRRMGLEDSEHIARILIHPEDSDTVFVAAQGPLWSDGGDRGVYMTGDGGETWTKLLDISPMTGVSDLVMDPRDPDVLYASAYQRRRHVWTLLDGGPESGIYKSVDGGESWNELTGGLPSGDKGRIALAISPQRPDVVYALVDAADDQEGTYVSTDAGASWSKRSDYVSGSPQYYQELIVDPHQFDRLYSMDTFTQVTDDGGRTWNSVGEADKHIDNHALWIDPHDQDHLINGNDGGVYESFDRGETWRFIPNLPLAQYYNMDVGNDAPFYTVCAGTQDNATHCGPARNDSVNGVLSSDWYVPVFGDGFEPAIDPTDSDIIYAQWQHGGLVRYDHHTGESVDVKPRESADGPPLRWNWDSAVMISPHDNERLYFGAQMLFRTDDRGNSWRPISGDLTRNMDRNRLEIMGRVWSVDSVRKNNSTSFYGTLVSVDESALMEGLIYTGSDDGLIHVTEDGGDNWTRHESFPGVPEMTYVNDITTSLHDPDTVFAAFNNHKMGDFAPYVLKSTDRGAIWTSIAGNLPERGSVYSIEQDHVDPDLLFAGTEFGVWATVDGGDNWFELAAGMPTMAARDVDIQRQMDDLVVATFGRGFYILDDYSPLRHLDDEVMASDAHVFPIRDALAYIERTPIALTGRAFQGADFYTGDNPPFGATFTYWIGERVQTREAERREREREAAGEGEDVFYPTWEELKAEDRERDPAVILTVRDADGGVVRRLAGRNARGVHRATWDLRYPGFTPVSTRDDGNGPMVAPGAYTVEVHRWHDGELEQLAGPTSFEVTPIGDPTISRVAWAEQAEFNRRVGELQRVAMGAMAAAGDAAERLEVIESAVRRHPQVELELLTDVVALQDRLRDLQEVLTGDPTKRRRSEPEMPGLAQRIGTVVGGTWSVTGGPTQTHREQFEIASAELESVLPELRTFLEQALPALEARLEEAGVPWTPGRGVPEWRR